MHDVDEESKTITFTGSDWPAGSGAGVAMRGVNNVPTDDISDHVASLKKK